MDLRTIPATARDAVAGRDPASELAMRAAAGDRASLAALIDCTQRDVWRYVAFHAGPGDADDLTQETYLRAIGALPGFQGRSSFRTWVLVIARRVVIDDLRRRMARPRTVSSDDWAELVDQAHGRLAPAAGPAEIVELQLMLAELSAERREALVLTQVLGLSYQEVATICGCPVGTIRSRVARGRDDLIRTSRCGDTDGTTAVG